MSLETIALRAYAVPKGTRRSRSSTQPGKARKPAKPRLALILDTESTVDAAQALTFGSYRYVRISWRGDVPTLSTVEEGLVYADDLEGTDPGGFETLRGYGGEHLAELDPAYSHGVPVPLRLYSRREFLDKVFRPAAYESRALVCGFNLPFDLSRLAFAWSRARGLFAGGFSLPLFEYEKDGVWHENRFLPRITVKSIDSKRSLKGFSGERSPDPIDQIPEGETEPDPAYFFRGNFLDLRTLAFALTNEPHSLKSACKAFGMARGKTKPEKHGEITRRYIDYNRNDVAITTELVGRMLEEYYRHPVDLRPTKAYSPASLGKAYLRAMGIRPMLSRQPDFPRDVLGHAENAYFGGRAECRIRRIPVPVTYTDFTSMYPTVNALMDNWSLLTARQVKVTKAQREVQELLERLTIDDCFDPKLWPQLRALVKVKPSGQPLPTRARYDRRRPGASAASLSKKQRQGQSWQAGINYLTSEKPIWFALPDLVAAKVLGGEVPQVLEALRFEPVGRQAGLAEVKLRGTLPVDPATTDFFRTIIEERQRVKQRARAEGRRDDPLERFLKVLANATSYGVFGEFVRHELGGRRTEAVTVWDSEGKAFVTRTHAPEVPGELCFPPLAAFITSAARLMLALLEARVTERGGSYAFVDTDSMAIVSDRESRLVECPGGPHRTPEGRSALRALSWDEVDEIRAQFETLNPYDRSAVPSVIKVEDENYAQGGRATLYCYAISAKRYVLYHLDDHGEPLLAKRSEHGLGHLLNPYDPDEGNLIEEDGEDGKKKPDWIGEAWRDILAKDVFAAKAKEPPWWHDPALARLTISSPGLLEPFAGMNGGRSYREQVKPFNFMLSARLDDLGYPVGLEDPQHFHLITPYVRKPRQALRARWFNRYDGKPCRVTIGTASDLRGQARVLTYGEVLEDYRYRPEYKSTAPDGATCDAETSGLLGRRAVEVLKFVYVGKQSNGLEEVKQGLLHDEQEALNQYDDPGHRDFAEFVVPVLASMSLNELRSASGMGLTALKDIRAGRARPHVENEEVLTVLALEHVREELAARSIELPDTHLALLRTYLETCGAEVRKCPVCGKLLASRRATYCGATCRKRAARGNPVS